MGRGNVGWESFEQAKQWGLSHGYSFLIMFGERVSMVCRSENEAKAHARMWRDSDRIPNVRIKRIK